MYKKFKFGKIDGYGNGRKSCLVTVSVELKERNGKPEFTASASVWNNLETDIIMGGQCLDSLNKVFSLRNNKTFALIYDMWKKYHLNGMNAGTKEQKTEVDKYLKENNKRYDYTEICEYLKSINMYEVEYNGKPYKYGHGWIHYDIPQEDLTIIYNLLNN